MWRLNEGLLWSVCVVTKKIYVIFVGGEIVNENMEYL